MTTMNTLTKAEYDDVIERLSNRALADVREAVDTPDDADVDTMFDAIGDSASGVVDDWLSEEGNAAIYGQILAPSEQDTAQYVDWNWRNRHGEGFDVPTDVIRKLAHLCMTPDVMEPSMSTVHQ